MTIRFSCPGCGKTFAKPDTLGGRRAVCRSCRGEFTIPAPSGSSASGPLNFTCPSCEHVYRKDNSLAGQRVRCRDCDTAFVVPRAPAATPARNSAAAPPASAPAQAPAAPRPVAAPVDDEVPLVLEVVNEEDDPYALQINVDDRPAVAAGPAVRPRPAASSSPARPSPARGKASAVVDRVRALPRRVQGGLLVLLALLALALVSWPGAALREAVGHIAGGGLEADDQPDDQLDQNPPTVVRPDVLARHEATLADLTRGVNALAGVLKGVRDGPTLAAATQRVTAAARQIEAAGVAGQKLPRTNRAEALRIRAGVLPRLETAMTGLMSTLAEGMRHQDLRVAYEPMQRAFGALIPEMQKDYPDAPECVVELKVPGVKNRPLEEFVRQRFDLEIPQAYRRMVRIGTDGNTGVQRIRLGPVEEPDEVARRIKFAKVVRVYGRRIYLDAPTPSEDDLAAARAATAVVEKAREAQRPGQPGPDGPAINGPAPASAPPPQGGPPIESGTWFVVFRGRDPKLWNTDTPAGPTTAVSLAKAPANIAFLRLTRLDTGEAQIVAVAPVALASAPAPVVAPDASPPPRWSGANRNDWGAHHLGIIEGRLIRGSDPVMRGLPVVQVDGVDGYTGSGFAHLGFGESRQYYAWRGKEIPPTDFEIAVGPGPLSPAEQAQLLAGHGP